MDQPFSVRDEPYGRVHDYSPPVSVTPSRSDNVSHSYAPPNHDTGRGWAFDDALEACAACGAVGFVLGLAAASIASRVFSMGWLGTIGVGVGVFALPFVWPIEWPFDWRNPFLAYSKTRWQHQQIVLEYHAAAIERLRPQASSEPAPVTLATSTVTRPALDAGEMFYLQCAAVLARATTKPNTPRTASEKIQMTMPDDTIVVVTKDDYKDVAGMLCVLGFMVGGEEGPGPRNYAIAPAWEGKSVKELWAALKEHKTTIMAWGQDG